MLSSRRARVAAAAVAAAVIAGVVGVLATSGGGRSSPAGSSSTVTTAPTSVTHPTGPTGTLPPLTSSVAAPLTGSLPQPVVSVTSVGAVGDGRTDSTGAIVAAIARAQANGRGTVYFPAGTYLVGQPGRGTTLKIDSGPAITLAGAGMDKSTIIETQPAQDLLGVKVDGVVIQDLTLDTRTYGAGHCLGVVANNTTLQRAHVLSGNRTFALYYAGPPGATPTAPAYNTGNRVLDSVIEDDVADDGFSFSFQKDGLIRDIVHRGSRLALYVDSNVLVDGYRYLPGSQKGATNGFWVTPPSDHITIRNFVSAGNGGVVGTNHGVASRVNTTIEIDGERLLSPGFKLLIGDIDGLTIQDGNYAGNDVRFNPSVEATHVVVVGSTLSAVTFAQSKNANVDDVDFRDDLYGLVTTGPDRPSEATFATLHGGPTSFTAEGGQFDNQTGGFQSGGNTHFQQAVPGG